MHGLLLQKMSLLPCSRPVLRMMIDRAEAFDVDPPQQVAAGAELPRQTGNLYTGSLWSGLASLVSQEGCELESTQVSPATRRNLTLLADPRVRSTAD